jgi:Gpi18-like mannosyltransferase
MQLPIAPLKLWLKHSSTRDILWLFFLTRVLLILVTYFSYIFLTQEKYSGAPTSLATFLASWNQWDAIRYLSIAQHGYQLPYDLAFFPLFPLLVGAIARPLGDGSYLPIGMLVSNLALLGSLFVLYRLAEEISDGQVARRTLLYLCIFPTALFFFAAYNESLFLLLTSSTLLALRHQRWWLAGILGCFSVLTRSAGLLLGAIYLYELWLHRAQVRQSWQTLLSSLFPLLLLPLGLVLFCLYCWQLSGDPIAFATVQIHWARQLSWPWQGIWQNLFELFWNQPFGSFNQVHILLDLAATLGFILLIFLGRKLIPPSFTLWGALLLFYILLSPSVWQHDALISNQRFVLEVFPAFITLALLGQRHPRFHQVLLWVFPALLATLSLLFVMGQWMV